jgi:signal peptidase II
MKMQKIILTGFIILLAFADQLSKWWVIEVFYKPRVFEADGATLSFWSWLTTFGQTQFPPTSIEVTSFFNLVMVWNKGVSFGMFSSAAEYMPYILSGVAVIMVMILIYMMTRAKHLSALSPMAMIIAGALANVWDRLRFGAVADFLDFHMGDAHYPAFNIADCSIVVGVLLLAFDGVILERRRLRQKDVKDE